MGADTADRKHKASRMTIAKEHLGRSNYDGNKLLNFIVTRDEMWVHNAEA